MLLIIDNKSAFIKQFRNNWLEDNDIAYRFFDHNQPLCLDNPEDVKGIILSGGKGNPYEPLNLTTNFISLMRFDVPVLGFCLGHEIITVAYGGRIKKLPNYQNKRETIHILKPEDPIFKGIHEQNLLLKEKHHFYVHKLPEEFVTLGESAVCPHEVIRHKNKPIYGFQSHPEVSGSIGLKIIENFLHLCGIGIQ